MRVQVVTFDGVEDLDAVAPLEVLGFAAAPEGTRAQLQRGALPATLREAVRPGLTLASVCSGAMLLAAGGITNGRPCTTHSTARDDLIAAGGEWVDARVVDDGDLVTAGGVTSGLDLALWLLERELGPQAATDTEQFLEYERRGTVWRAPALHT